MGMPLFFACCLRALSSSSVKRTLTVLSLAMPTTVAHNVAVIRITLLRSHEDADRFWGIEPHRLAWQGSAPSPHINDGGFRVPSQTLPF